MNPIISLFIFGWPLFIISILVSVMGILNKGYGLVLLGAVFILPYTYYLNNTKTFFGFALLIPIFHFCCAWAVKEENDVWAWILIAPTIVSRLWLLVVVWAYTNLGPS